MKKFKQLFLVALLVLCVFSVAACKKNKKFTVTYYQVTLGKEALPADAPEGTVPATTYEVKEVGKEEVEKNGKISGVAVAADGSKYIAPKYFTSKEVDKDANAYDSEASVTGDLELFAEDKNFAYFQEMATGTGYTLNYSITEFPTTWNSHIYETATDSTVLGYLSSGFYDFDYNENKDGYKWVNNMAVAEPKDVTANYVGEQWGIEEGDTARAWEIEIRNDLCWDDGTPITADDFVESAKRLLNPKAMNSRADDYTYGGDFVVHNAKNYILQGSDQYMTLGDYYDDAAAAKADGKTIYLDLNALDPVFEEIVGVSLSTLKKSYASYYNSWFVIYDPETGEPAKDAAGNNVIFFEKYGDIWDSDKGNRLVATDEVIADWNNCLDFFDEGETGDDYVPYFFAVPIAYPELSWDNVGIIKSAPYKIVYILDQELSGFYLKYSLSTYLVKADVYDACNNLDANGNLPEGEVYHSTYCTDATNSPSYGPYKLVAYQLDKYFRFEKNANYWEFKDADKQGLYQTTAVVYTKADSASTRLQMFLSGLFDSYGLTSDDMADYQDSKYTYFTDGDSTWFIALNPDLSAYEAAEYNLNDDGSRGTHKNIDKQIMYIKEFRQALSFALDRAAYELACDPTGNVAKALFSPMIISDPENGTVYRNTAPAKEAIVKFWGLADQIGEGKLYATIDEAIDSITGYNLAMAKQYFTTAYEKAVEAGYIDADDVVTILIGTPNLTSTYYNKGYEFLKNCYTDAVKGTPLEGRIAFERDGTLGNKFGDRLRDNSVDMLFGVGWTGNALNPYGLIEVYTTYYNRYNPAEDFTKIDMTVDLPAKYVEGEEAGEEIRTYKASAADWTDALKGGKIKVTREVEDGDPLVFENVSFGTTVDYSIRGLVLAAIEVCALEQYEMIPIAYDSSASLKGMKVNFYTEEYVYGVGRGGIKYMTFNYNDSEWAAFVASQGGKLNYKVSDAE
ncbi:MAG: hypothetical protein J6X93_03060 [Bacilli bacterium]|nr:hypothetical protein [Bacilli bacterium]